jgi:uncharacterized protein (UPF0276 family)
MPHPADPWGRIVSLGSDVPDYLNDLLTTDRVQIDHVKVGLWQGAARARRELAVAARMPISTVLLHGDDLAAGDDPLPAQALDELVALVEETRTPWFSLHIEHRTPQEKETFKRTDYTHPDLPRHRAVERIVRRVEQIKSALGVPVLLENVPPWAGDVPDMVVDPEFISEVLVETECDLLLGLSHARVSGDRLGLPYEDYLSRLPLGRVVEVHVSGPRRGRRMRPIWGGPLAGQRKRVLWDSHEPMRKDDYDLLAWLLRHHRPQAITLEYWKDPARHAAQLKRLRHMLQSVWR